MKLDNFLKFLTSQQTQKNLAEALSIGTILNGAANCLDEGEIYYQLGLSSLETLIQTLKNNFESLVYILEPEGQSDLDVLLEALDEHIEQINFFQESPEEFFSELRNNSADIQVGLYYIDYPVDYRLQLMSLELIRPFLSSQALLVISNSQLASVKQAVGDFILLNPQVRIEQENLNEFYYLLSWDTQRSLSYSYKEIKDKFSQSNLLAKLAILENEILQSSIQQGDQYRENGELAKAEQIYLKIISNNPKIADLWFKLGLINEQLKRYDLAIHTYKSALLIEPKKTEAYHQLGNISYLLGLIEEAEQYNQKAEALAPNSPHILVNLANVLLVKGNTLEAIKLYQRAQTLAPGEKEIIENQHLAQILAQDALALSQYQGDYFFNKKRYEQAIIYYQINFQSEQAPEEIYLKLGQCYEKIRQEDKAHQVYSAGLLKYPDNFKLNLFLIINLHHNVGDILGAISTTQLLLDKNPQNLSIKFEAMRIVPLIYQDKEEILQYRERFIQELEQIIDSVSLETPADIEKARDGISHQANFFLAYQGVNDLEIQCKYGDLVCRIMQASYPNLLNPSRKVRTNQKIKIGYISSYIYGHSVTRYSYGWLKYLDRQMFEIYGYHVEKKQDRVTEEFRSYCNYFYNIPSELDAVIEQVLKNELDIIVYLDLGMHPKTIQLAALKLAPIQCSGWGHPVTSGLATIDYYLSSDLMEPANAQEYYREKLVRLPQLGLVINNPAPTLTSPNRADFGLPTEKIVYLCSQSLWKYLPQYDLVWPAIAKEVPNSHFAFFEHFGKGTTSKFENRLEKIFAQYNLNWQEYCTIYPKLIYENFLHFNRLCDIFLDSFSWSGGITSIDAISAGLPIVTVPGEFMRGRQAYGILKQIDITETIAQDIDGYIKIAINLGLDPDWRSEICTKITQNAHLLFEDISPIKGLEDFYQKVCPQSP